ncbi:MAG: hypothetical protein Q7R45_02300 [Sulfuricaulis sp.]|nr:hypothetical protein [Sulfuricaulis sp.]
MLRLMGAVLLAVSLVLTQVKPLGILGVAGWASVPSGLPIWLRVSILAGAYLLEWGPVLAGLLIIYYASRIKR